MYRSVAKLDSTHVIIAYRRGGNGKAVVGTISGSSISFDDPVQFEDGGIDYVSTTTLDSTRIFIAYHDNGNSEYGTAIIAVYG